VIYVWTHDSIAMGEDGPTHQPVEQTATLRLIPGMHVWRTCDAVETTVAWRAAFERQDGPTTLVFSRQNLPHVPRTDAQLANIAKGGYTVSETQGQPDAIIIATGSEIELALKAAEALKAEGKNVRVVSMPCTNVFDAQDEAYKESVLPKAVTQRVAIEAGVTDGWWKYVGTNGKVLGLDRFGESAPAGLLFKEFGFTAENAVAVVKAVL